jgi:hypothetical protein
MKWCNGPKITLALAVLLWAGWRAIAWGAPLGASQVGTQIVDKFRLPEFGTNGVKKSEIFGDRAAISPDGRVNIAGLKILVYREGVVEGTLDSAECVFDRQEKNAVSDAGVTIRRGNMLVTGTGFRWTSGSQRIEILNDVRVTLQGIPVWMKKEK